MTITTFAVLVLVCQCLSCLCQVQVDINDKMRAILVDWLVEVHLKFKVCICKPSDVIASA